MASSNVKTSVGYLQEENQRLTMRVKSCLAGTIVAIACLPEKLNPLIRPLMDCVKTEADSVMQVWGMGVVDGKWVWLILGLCMYVMLREMGVVKHCGWLRETNVVKYGGCGYIIDIVFMERSYHS